MILKIRQGFYAALVLLIFMDWFLPKEEGLFAGQMWVGFNACYGFISCVLIIFVSKFLGHIGLSKREDYYV